MSTTAVNWSMLTAVDYGILITLFLSALLSISRGLVREALSLGVWVGAFWVSMHYGASLLPEVITKWLENIITSNDIRHAVIRGSIFMLIVIGGTLIISPFAHIMRASSLSGVDRLLGFIFGVARGCFIIAFTIVMVSKVDVITERDDWKHAQLIGQFKPLTGLLKEWFPETTEEVYNRFYNNKRR